MSSSRLTFSTFWRGFALLFTAAPFAVGGHFLVAAVTAVITPVVFGSIGSIVTRLESGTGGLTGQVVLIGVALVAGELLGQVQVFMFTFAENRFILSVYDRISRATAALPGLAHFEDPEFADLLTVAQGAGAKGSELMGVLQHQVNRTVAVAGLAVLAARVAWWAPLVVLATAIPAGVQFWRGTSVEFAEQMRGVPESRAAEYARQLSLDPRAAKELRVFGLGRWLIDRQAAHWSAATGPVFAARLATAKRAVGASLVLFSIGSVPFVVAFARLASGSLEAGDFTTSMLALSQLLSMTGSFGGVPAFVRDQVRMLQKIVVLMDLARDDPRLDVRGVRTPPAAPAAGIRFEDVSFRYPSREDPVLDGLNLHLPAGRSVALVGVNGAGKSTIVKLLTRMYDPAEGRITLDGTDLREFDLVELRRRFAVVFQEFMRLQLSARVNVGVGCLERLDDDRLLITAAERASAMPLIDQLPDGWDSPLAREFGGVDVSEGQWQRLALARAMASVAGRGSAILVLDEPTAALDVRVEHDLYTRFRELAAGRTTLLISHRLSTVRMADTIAFLDGGRITEHGPHDELLSKNGAYAELWNLQARRFRDEGAIE